MDIMGKMVKFVLAGFVVLVILGSGCTYGDGERSLLISSDETEPNGASTLAEGVTGRLANLEGHPVEGAFVQADSPSGDGPPIPDIAILSDSTGRYAWPLAPGAYRLSVTVDGYKPISGFVTVQTGEVSTLDFTLEKMP